jgi:hypothetical protein
MKTFQLLRSVAIAGCLVVGSLLFLNKSAASQEYPTTIMRGPHGAVHILSKPGEMGKSTMMKHKAVKSTRMDREGRSTPLWITRGPHGAVFGVDKPGIGGPEGSGYYPGFPRIRMRGSHGGFQIVE